MKFIKLTESHTSGSHIPIIINIENILTIKPSERSKDTHVQFKEKYIFVSETVTSFLTCQHEPCGTGQDQGDLDRGGISCT